MIIISSFLFLSGSGKNAILEELKDNERENFRTMAEKVSTSLAKSWSVKSLYRDVLIIYTLVYLRCKNWVEFH